MNAPDARNDRRREDRGEVEADGYQEAGTEVALAELQKAKQ